MSEIRRMKVIITREIVVKQVFHVDIVDGDEGKAKKELKKVTLKYLKRALRDVPAKLKFVSNEHAVYLPYTYDEVTGEIAYD